MQIDQRKNQRNNQKIMDKNIKYTKADLIKIYQTRTGPVGFRKELVSLYFFLTGLFFCWVFYISGWKLITWFAKAEYLIQLFTFSLRAGEVLILFLCFLFIMIELYLIVGPFCCSYVFLKEVRAIKAYLRQEQHATT